MSASCQARTLEAYCGINWTYAPSNLCTAGALDIWKDIAD